MYEESDKYDVPIDISVHTSYYATIQMLLRAKNNTRFVSIGHAYGIGRLSASLLPYRENSDYDSDRVIEINPLDSVEYIHSRDGLDSYSVLVVRFINESRMYRKGDTW